MTNIGKMNDMPNIEVDSMMRNPAKPRSSPANMSDDDQKDMGAAIEPDGDVPSEDEKSQDQQNLTRPKMPMTDESLRLLGAGSPYQSKNK